MSDEKTVAVGDEVVFGEYMAGTEKEDVVFVKGDKLIIKSEDNSGTEDNPSYVAQRVSDNIMGYTFLKELEQEEEALETPVETPVAKPRAKAAGKVKPKAKKETTLELPLETGSKSKAKAKAKPVAAKPVAKLVAKGKVKAKSAVKKVEAVVEGVTLKTMMGDTAESVLRAAKDVVDRLQTDYYYLGGILAKIKQEAYYETIMGEGGKLLEGQAGFETYINSELGLEYRSAMHYMGIFEVLTAAGIPESEIKGLRWTKIAKLLGLITAGIITKDNWSEWAKMARDLKGDAYTEAVDSAKVEAGIESMASRGATANQRKFTFVFFDDVATTVDKAIEVAKEKLPPVEGEGGNTDSAALHLIISEWITMTSDSE